LLHLVKSKKKARVHVTKNLIDKAIYYMAQLYISNSMIIIILHLWARLFKRIEN